MPLLIFFVGLLLSGVGIASALLLSACAVVLPFGFGTAGECRDQAVLSGYVANEADLRIAQLAAEVAMLAGDLARLECTPSQLDETLPPADLPAFAIPEATLPTDLPASTIPEATLPTDLPASTIPEQTLQERGPSPVEDLREADFEQGDVAVLEGCWELDSDYRAVDEATGAVSSFDKWSICFDTNGRGVERMRTESGDACVGPVSGTFGEGVLQIVEPGDLSCNSGNVIYRREMDCSLDGQGFAQCSVRQPEVNTASTARLRRSVGEE